MPVFNATVKFPPDKVFDGNFGAYQLTLIEIEGVGEARMFNPPHVHPYSSLQKGQKIQVTCSTTKSGKDSWKLVEGSAQSPQAQATNPAKKASKEEIVASIGSFSRMLLTCRKAITEEAAKLGVEIPPEDVREMAATVFIATVRKHNLN